MTAAVAAPTATAGPLAAAGQVAARTLRRFARTPQLLVVETVQGVLFLLVFRFVLGGAIDAGDVDYVDFLVPGFVTAGLLFSSAAVGVAEDAAEGLFDRLRSLPVPRASILLGRVLADTALMAWSAAVTVAVGFAAGFGLGGSVAEGLAAFGLLVVYALAFAWVFAALGLVAGGPQAAQGLALLGVPFSFLSATFVPPASMPGVLEAFAEHQPLTPMVETVRALALGEPVGSSLVLSLAWSAALVAVFAPLALRRFTHG